MIHKLLSVDDLVKMQLGQDDNIVIMKKEEQREYSVSICGQYVMLNGHTNRSKPDVFFVADDISVYKLLLKLLRGVLVHGDLIQFKSVFYIFSCQKKGKCEFELLTNSIIPISISSRVSNSLLYFKHVLKHQMFVILITMDDDLIKRLQIDKPVLDSIKKTLFINYNSIKSEMCLVHDGNPIATFKVGLSRALDFTTSSIEFVPPFFIQDIETCDEANEYMSEEYATFESNLYKYIVSLWYRQKQKTTVNLNLNLTHFLQDVALQHHVQIVNAVCTCTLQGDSSAVHKFMNHFEATDTNIKPISVKTIAVKQGLPAANIDEGFIINPLTGHPIKSNGLLAAKLRKQGVIS